MEVPLIVNSKLMVSDEVVSILINMFQLLISYLMSHWPYCILFTFSILEFNTLMVVCIALEKQKMPPFACMVNKICEK